MSMYLLPKTNLNTWRVREEPSFARWQFQEKISPGEMGKGLY